MRSPFTNDLRILTVLVYNSHACFAGMLPLYEVSVQTTMQAWVLVARIALAPSAQGKHGCGILLNQILEMRGFPWIFLGLDRYGRFRLRVTHQLPRRNA
jgi:hypothetical protein